MIARARFALIAALAAVAGCSSVIGPDLPSTPVALFDRVWSDVDLHYSLFGAKAIDWDSLRDEYRPLALAAQSDDEASEVIAGMLSRLQDDHVVFRGSRVGTPARGDAYDPMNVSRRVTFQVGFDDGLWFGNSGTAVGYIRIASFEGTGWVTEIDSALAQLKGVSGMIVDVRNNDGGFLGNATAVAGRFAQRTTPAAYVRYRNGPKHNAFTDPIEQWVSPAGARRFPGRVVVLTGRNTISAAELFVMSMHALGNTTVVGDTTAGETGSPFARELQNGWSYQFPESIEYTLNGHEFENIGLPPDVTVKNLDTDTAKGIDAQLNKAISILLGTVSESRSEGRGGSVP